MSEDFSGGKLREMFCCSIGTSTSSPSVRSILVGIAGSMCPAGAVCLRRRAIAKLQKFVSDDQRNKSCLGMTESLPNKTTPSTKLDSITSEVSAVNIGIRGLVSIQECKHLLAPQSLEIVANQVVGEDHASRP